MKLTKKQREALKQKFGGFCAYCGTALGDRWHADHVNAVKRQGHWKRAISPGKTWGPMVWVADKTMKHPERDTVDNFYPACVACNVDKSDTELEAWRAKLQLTLEVLVNNYGRYKDALRFGLIVETPKPIEFHFERWRKKTPRRQLNEDTP